MTYSKSKLDQRFLAIIDTIADGIVMINKNKKIELVNPAIEAMSGYLAEEMLGQNINMLIPKIHHQDFNDYLENVNLTETENHPVIDSGILNILDKSGSTFPVELKLSFATEADINYIINVRDIRQDANVEKQFLHLSYHDALTGLPNRPHYVDKVNQAIAEAKHSGTTFVVVVFGLNRFKKINDSLGQTGGDVLLMEVA